LKQQVASLSSENHRLRMELTQQIAVNRIERNGNPQQLNSNLQNNENKGLGWGHSITSQTPLSGHRNYWLRREESFLEKNNNILTEPKAFRTRTSYKGNGDFHTDNISDVILKSNEDRQHILQGVQSQLLSFSVPNTPSYRENASSTSNIRKLMCAMLRLSNSRYNFSVSVGQNGKCLNEELDAFRQQLRMRHLKTPNILSQPTMQKIDTTSKQDRFEMLRRNIAQKSSPSSLQVLYRAILMNEILN